MTAAWTFRITAAHLLQNLANTLYGEPGESLMELVRNAVVACMNGHWAPRDASVEITLAANKLAGGLKALVVLDHGSGFTDACIRRFCEIGASLTNKEEPKMHGASQKRIGRFAAFALNRNCVDGDTGSGFYILTRTQPRGQVKLVTMIPALIEQDQGVTPRWIDASSAEMGPLKGIEGSFSAVVIPNPVFASAGDIRRALEWRIPRKMDQMFSISVDGKKLQPPALSSRVCCEEQGCRGVEVFIDKAEEGEDSGIYICDKATGFRVAFAPQIGPSHMPSPFWRRDLKGDIFIHDALANQDTGRGRLNPRYLKGKVWRDAMLYLAGNVGADVRALLGDSDIFGSSRVRNDLMAFVELCKGIYGDPDSGVEGPDLGSKKSPSPGSERTSPTPRVGEGKEGNRKVRTLPFRLGDRTFFFCKRTLDPDVMAQVDPTGRVIYFNEGYGAMPTTQGARQEHVILQVLGAIGTHDYPADTASALIFVASTRRELMKK